LLTGDVIAVRDPQTVTFMHNYPKQIPLPASAIGRIVEAIAPFEFERIHGCWPQDLVPARGKQVVLQSAQRYLERIAT
jgi:hypothetical protein